VGNKVASSYRKGYFFGLPMVGNSSGARELMKWQRWGGWLGCGAEMGAEVLASIGAGADKHLWESVVPWGTRPAACTLVNASYFQSTSSKLE